MESLRDHLDLPFQGTRRPAGSLLLGSRALIPRRIRQRQINWGWLWACGQAGYLAAAGLFALEHNVKRLQEDHRKAKALEAELRSLPYVSSVLPVETNIVIFELHEPLSAELFLQQLQHQQVRALSMGRQTIRFVFPSECQRRAGSRPCSAPCVAFACRLDWHACDVEQPQRPRSFQRHRS